MISVMSKCVGGKKHILLYLLLYIIIVVLNDVRRVNLYCRGIFMLMNNTLTSLSHYKWVNI